MIDRERNKGEQCLRYDINKWKIKGFFDIFNDISKNFSLVQLVGGNGDTNHAVSIVGKWIFDSNYKISLPLTA